ncbi:MAG: DUF1015 domain-containing protein [Wujia sp.]
MADIRPFQAFRPRKDIVDAVAALPYDVYNRAEAKAAIEGKPLSFLRIDRAETAFDDSVDTYAPCVYQKAKELLDDMIARGEYVQDDTPMYYLYELVMDGRSQTGIVACAAIEDYESGVIMKHENTRADKEIDRITHVDTCNAQTGPIFLAYRANAQMDEVVERIKRLDPEFDFTSEDGITHRGWLIADASDIRTIEEGFRDMNQIYIADGHHRAASAVKVGIKRRNENPNHTGNEEYNHFLSVLFPHDQLKILPYNRVVMDLNGFTKETFLEKLTENFTYECVDQAYQPDKKATFGMYLDGQWYKLSAKPQVLSEDPVDGLDVSILQDYLLSPILGIGDPRTDKRIDFIGGIRGLAELERRANSDMKLAFSMYPTSIEELFAVADAHKLMPPKSTWFEPKLRSGIFIHKL